MLCEWWACLIVLVICIAGFGPSVAATSISSTPRVCEVVVLLECQLVYCKLSKKGLCTLWNPYVFLSITLSKNLANGTAIWSFLIKFSSLFILCFVVTLLNIVYAFFNFDFEVFPQIHLMKDYHLLIVTIQCAFYISTYV